VVDEVAQTMLLTYDTVVTHRPVAVAASPVRQG
jgi:hypothetical protein